MGLLKKKRYSQGSVSKLVIEHNGMYPYLLHYLDWLVVKGYSSSTAHRRNSVLRQFIAWCDERELNQPSQVTKPIIERYQRHLFYYRQSNGKPLAYSSQANQLVQLKAWFKWLTQENHIGSNPASEVQGVRPPKKLPPAVLSVEEVESILTSVDINQPEGLRDRAMLELLYSKGIRRSELCWLQLQDIHYGRQSLFVREGKGGKDRYIPIGQRALDWANRYHHHVRPLLLIDANEQSLFLSDYGEPYTPSAMGHKVKRLLKKANVSHEGSCHLFRHAMATHMLENGAELRHIQAILGHADINTTTIYTHLTIETLKDVHSATHPSQRHQ